jgi:electron transport complex protein RnfA
MNFTQLLSLSLGAILIENFVLVKFLGVCPFLGVSKKMDTAIGMSFSVIFVMGTASAFTYAVNEFILKRFSLEYMRTIAFILIIASLVQLVEMFLKKTVPALYHALGIYLPLITTNCAILGAVILNTQNDLNLLGSVTYGVSAAIGFMLAVILFTSVRERLEFADIPAPFQGFPIVLIAAALISMSFMGFSGLKIFS